MRKHHPFPSQVEARRLPNERPLALLGVSVRGLPVSDAPILDVSRPRGEPTWSSAERPDAVEWDGDEAFYSLGDDACVIRGDFAIVVRFGGKYGAQGGGADAAPIARYVASSGFLCDGAIDARREDIDVHPAYASGREQGASMSLQLANVAMKCVKERVHSLRTQREMISRPKI